MTVPPVPGGSEPRLLDRLGAYRLPYALTRTRDLARAALGRRRAAEYDIVFVVPEEMRGWIVEAIAREVAARFDGRCVFHYSAAGLPPARAYFFAHHAIYADALAVSSVVWSARRVVWYTHPGPWRGSRTELMHALTRASAVLFMCSLWRDRMLDAGFPAGRSDVVLGAADPDVFRPHQRGGGKVGLCAAYYPRKSPEKLVRLIRAMPHREFLLLGRGWNQYPGFDDLLRLPNFEYAEAPYREYPAQYARMDVMVSAAELEGGPIPLVEAMMANVVPVASRTGFAPDLIRDGENGFTFEVAAPVETIAGLVDRAFDLDGDVRATAAHLSWDRLADQVLGHLRPDGPAAVRHRGRLAEPGEDAA